MKRLSASALINAAVVVIVAMSTVLAGWALLRQESEVTQILSTDIQITNTGDLSGDELLQELDRISSVTGESIVMPETRLGGRTLYVGSGGTAAAWLAHGYPSVIPGENVAVKPLNDIPFAEARQLYELGGSQQAKQQIEQLLDAHGGSYTSYPILWLQTLVARSDFSQIMAIASLIVMALVVFCGVLSTKSYAVGKLHGMSFPRRFIREVLTTHRRLMLGVLCWIPIPPAVILLMYSPLTAGIYLRYFFGFLALFLGVAGVATAVSLSLITRTPIMEALKGRIRKTAAISVGLLVRIATVVLLISLCISVATQGKEWRAQKAEAALWEGKPNLYELDITGARELDERDADNAVLAEKVRELGRAGQAALVAYQDKFAVADPESNVDLMTYSLGVARTSLPAELAATVDSQWNGIGLLLVPPGSPQSFSLGTTGKEVCSTQQCLRVPVGEFSAFSWDASGLDFMERLRVRSPAVLVLPDGEFGSNDRNVVAAITQGDIAFTEQAVSALRADPQIGGYIVGAEPKSSRWASGHSALTSEFTVSVFGLVLIILLGSVFSALAVLSYVLAFRQRIAVLRSLGHNLAGIWARILPFELITLAVAGWYIWRKTAVTRGWDAIGGGGASPSLRALLDVPASAIYGALGIVLFFVVLSAVSLSLMSRRIMAE